MLNEAMELLNHYPHRRDEITRRIEGWCCYWASDEWEKIVQRHEEKIKERIKEIKERRGRGLKSLEIVRS
jgi:hypothetical protein